MKLNTDEKLALVLIVLGAGSRLLHLPPNIAAVTGVTGMWRCTLPDGTPLRAAGLGPAAPGGACVLCVRPESIAIAAPDHADPTRNVLDAVVEDVVFQGGVSHVRVRAPGGLFACEERGGDAGRAPGERVRIAWAPADGILVPE